MDKINSSTLTRVTTLTIVCLAFFMTFSCRKNVRKIDDNYIGYWAEVDSISGKGCRLYINITSDGESSVISYDDSREKECYRVDKHKAKANSKTFKIGPKVYDLKESPTLIDTISLRISSGSSQKSNMRMQLDDRTLFKIISK